MIRILGWVPSLGQGYHSQDELFLGEGDAVEGWLVLTLPGRDDPVILECLSAHKLAHASGASSPPYEFITRLPPAEEVLSLPTGQPMEFLFQGDGRQLRGYLLLKQMSADGNRLRLETTGEVAEGF